jgi:hypothetical protein
VGAILKDGARFLPPQQSAEGAIYTSPGEAQQSF